MSAPSVAQLRVGQATLPRVSPSQTEQHHVTWASPSPEPGRHLGFALQTNLELLSSCRQALAPKVPVRLLGPASPPLGR